MTEKLAKSKALRELMKHNNDLALPQDAEPDFLATPTPAARGSEQPPIELNVMALIGISGAQVRWNWNFWVVTRRDGARAHVAAHADFAEWYRQIVGKEYIE